MGKKGKRRVEIYEVRTRFLNNVYWIPTLTLAGHVLVKCQIQKISVGFFTILIWFKHNFKNEKYIHFQTNQIYCINF